MRAGASFLLVGCAVTTATAATPPLPVVYQPCAATISVDDRWALTPIVVNDNGVVYVHSILALNKVGMTNDEIKAVWYVRDLANGCKWNPKAWDGATPEDAIKHVKIELGINDATDDLWGVPLNMTTATPVQQVRVYSKGFDTDDPCGQLVNDLNNPWRDEDVAFLASIGYKAADVPFERKDMSDDPEFANLFLSTASALALQTAAVAPPVIPGPGPVGPGLPAWPTIPTMLPSGTPATPVILPCPGSCIPMTMTMKGGWTTWACASTWKSLPSAPAVGVCNYEKDCCRYRVVWTSTVATNCVVTYTFAGFESECWTHTVTCSSANSPAGSAFCPNPIDTQNQNCGTGLNPVPTPPAGTPIHPHP